MKEIQLTQGQIVLVDNDDYDLVSRYKWYAWWNKDTVSYYAVTHIPHPNGGKDGRRARRTLLYMPRLILGLEFGDRRQADHINHNTLDNRRANLRIATRAENARNQRGPNKNNTSGYLGVSWYKRGKKWSAQIAINKKLIYLGRFDNIHDAVATRDAAAIRLHGEFASLNRVS